MDVHVKTLLQNLHEELSCPVCRNTFTNPKQLPCLHSFCLHCLKELQRTSGRCGKIICPECRRDFRILGSGKPKELPTNFRLNSLLDVLAIKECHSTGVKCGNCDKTSPQCFYCFKCCVFWCEDCITAHNILRVNKEHYVLALKDFQDKDIEDVLKRAAFCEKKHHENEKLKFFCKDCGVAVCNTCVVTLHEGHSKAPLEEAANERKLRLNSEIESQEQTALETRSVITKLQNERAKIQAQVAVVKRNTQKFADSMVKVIEAKKQEVFREVEEKAKESLKRLDAKQCQLEDQLQRIMESIEQIKTLVNRSTSAEIAQLDTVILERAEEEIQEEDCDFEEPGCFVFVKNESLINKASCEGVGSVETLISKTKADQSTAGGKGINEATVGLEAQFVLSTRNGKGEWCYEGLDCVTMEIRNDQGHECATEVTVQDNKDGTYRISYFAKETGACQASVMVNGEHIHGSPFTVEIKTRQYRTVLSFGQQGSSVGNFVYPWGVAVSERNEIAVTDKNNARVQIFSSDGTYLRCFGRPGCEEGEFDEPRGIAFLGNENIAVVDSGNDRVQIFSGQGEYLTQFGGEGNLDHQLQSPCGLSVNGDGNIIVADTGNKLIKTFSPCGQFLSKFGEDSLIEPIHCIQKKNYLIVSDKGDHCIKVFNEEGELLYKFGEEEKSDGQFEAQYCMSIDKAGNLMVCDYFADRVMVFDISGHYITKFGKNGGEIGAFDGPVSAAVLADGRVVVSDICNNRIQILD